MSMVRRPFLGFLACLLLSAGSLTAQDGVIRGRVIDAMTLEPVVGASVSIQDMPIGALTGQGGTYEFAAPAGTHTVRATLIGYAPVAQEVTVAAGQAATADFELQIQAIVLEELVTTGYGTQRRLAITGSVATVDPDDADVGVLSNVNQMIEGRVAGLVVTRNTGEPGADAQVRIRGGTSISASNEPLYVIDGVPVQNVPTEPGGLGVGGGASLPRSPLNLLNPSDIAEITILKDASAAAIYGSRAANGVILIETKRGQPGQVSIEYDGYVAAASPASRLEVLDGAEYRAFVEAQVAAGTLDPSRLDGLGDASTNWEDAVTRTGVTQNHNLTFTGGTQATRFRASLNFMDQEGVALSSGFQRYQGRLNGTHSAFRDRLHLDLTLTSAHTENDYLQAQNTGGFEGDVFQNMVIFNPTQPVMVTDPETGLEEFFEIGTGRQSVRNPVAMADQLLDEASTTRTLGSLKGSYELTTNLSAQAIFGVDRSEGTRRTYFPAGSPVGAEWNGRARQVNRDKTDLTFQGLLTWQDQIADNQTLEIVAGYEAADYQIREFGAESRDFLTDAFGFSNLGGGSVTERPFSFQEDSRLVSVLSRANWSYRDRYFLTGVVRYDGSSRFGAGNKWAFFPAISGAWRLSEEDFLANGPFSELRLRAGWGLQGNQAVPPYSSLILLETNDGARYVFGNGAFTGVAPIRNPNPNLKWEQTSQINLAIDFGFNDNLYSGSIEYYRKNTTDLLLEVAVAQPAVVATRLENIGEVRNTGLEASFDAVLVNRSGFDWQAGLVFGTNKNEVVDLGGRTFISTGGVSGQGQSGQVAQRIMPGEPLGTFFGPEFVGVDDQGRQLFNRYDVERDEDGNVTSRILNGTTTSPGGDDFVVLGDANPDFSLGLSNRIGWGRLDASVFVRAEVGQDVFNNTALVYSTKGNVTQDKNFLRSALDDPIGIFEPAIFSSRWIEDGSFVRLQNITVGYRLDLPPAFGVRTARLYGSADNLFLLTGYSGYDPEVHIASGLASRGIDYLAYPRARTFTFGVQVGM